MKRPLFLAMVSFALGEVACVLSRSDRVLAMLVAALVFGVFLLMRRGKSVLLLPLFACAGFFYVGVLWDGGGTKEASYDTLQRVANVSESENCSFRVYVTGKGEKKYGSENASLLPQLGRVRDMAEERLYAATDEKTASLLSGILLGNRKGIDRDIRELYRTGGIAHVLAISSLHITLVAGVLLFLLEKLGVPVFPASGIAVAFVMVYAAMTGMGSATLRAVIMMVIVVVGRIAGRHYDMLTSLSVALFLMLVLKPERMYDGGVLMSFAAIFGVCLGRWWSDRVPRAKKIVFTLGLNMVLTPMILYIYYEIPTYGVLINVPVVLLLSPIVISGFLGLLVSFVSMPLASVFLLPAKYLLMFYEWLCRLNLRLSFHHVVTGKFSLWYLVAWYGILFAMVKVGHVIVVRFRRSFLTVVLMVSAGAFLFWTSFGILVSSGRQEMVLMMDVGQGDGIFLRADGGGCFMIDGGSSSEKGIGRYGIAPALRYYGVSRIDAWFVTHADADHISGLIEILEEGDLSGVTIKAIVLSDCIVVDGETEKLIGTAQAAGVPVVYMGDGDVISNGESTFTCLGPVDPLPSGDKNDASLILWYQSGSVDAVFTGDAGTEGLHCALDSPGNLPASGSVELLKVPHHGSKNSVCPALYDLLSDDSVSLISCGAKNSYGHPHKELLAALSETPTTILRTDKSGGVVVFIDE